MRDLILYDADCPFCQRCVLFVLKKDVQKKFVFSSLTGQTAKSLFQSLHLSNQESLVLIENYETEHPLVFYKSKAVFTLFWKLGGFWKGLGWKKIFPSWAFDWAYTLVSRNRKRLCKKNALDPKSIDPKRFLP